MTVNSTTIANSFPGTGTTGPFTYSFKIFNAADLVVIKADDAGNETPLALTTDYTITGVGNEAGGTITTVVAIELLEVIVLLYKPSILQLAAFRDQKDFEGARHEDTYDRNLRQTQVINRLLQGSPHLQETDNDGSVDMELPPLLPDTAIGINGTGDGLALLDAAFFATIAINGNFVVDQFVDPPDWTSGVTTVFALSASPGSENNVNIFLDGVYQEKTLFSLLGSTITFAVAPVGTLIEIVHGGAVDIGTPSDNTVSTPKIVALAVTTAKIDAKAVTTAKIADGAVDTLQLAADAVDGTKIGDDVVDSEHYVAGSIDSEHLTTDVVKEIHQGWSVKDKDLTTPPGGESVGDRYIIASPAAAAWGGNDDNIGEVVSTGPTVWAFQASTEGMVSYVDDEDELYAFDGTEWVRKTSLAATVDLDLGDGSDGALVVAAGTTDLDSFKTHQFTSIQIDAGATVRFLGGFGMIKCQGDCTIEGTLRCEVDSTGGAGGSGGGSGDAGENKFDALVWCGAGGGGTRSSIPSRAAGGGGGAGMVGDGGAGADDGGSVTPGAGGLNHVLDDAGGVAGNPDFSFYHAALHLITMARAGAGGQGADSDGGGSGGGNGGDAGGNLVLFVGGNLDGNTTGLIECNGEDGIGGGTNEAGGAGAGAGYLYILCDGTADDIALEAKGGDFGPDGNDEADGGNGGGGVVRLISGGAQTAVATDVTGGTGGTSGAGGGSNSVNGGPGDAATIQDEPRKYFL